MSPGDVPKAPFLLHALFVGSKLPASHLGSCRNLCSGGFSCDWLPQMVGDFGMNEVTLT